MDVRKYCPDQGLDQDKPLYKNHGFTLIELLITLSIASIFSLTIFPNFSALIAQERNTILTNSLASALAYARSEAITKNMTILTCQSNNGSECNKSANWHNGWITFVDTNENRQRDSNETLLRVFAAADNGTRAIFKGSGAGIKYYMKYKPSGRASPNGSFLICHPDIGVGKALIMAPSGRLRLSKIQTDGSAVTCD